MKDPYYWKDIHTAKDIKPTAYRFHRRIFNDYVYTRIENCSNLVTAGNFTIHLVKMNENKQQLY